MCNIQPVLQADAKLNKMLVLVKIILIVNLFSCFLRIFLNPSDMIFDLFGCLFLFLAYNSVYFLYMAMYIIFSLINSVMLFISCATVFQMLIQKTLGSLLSHIPLILGISLYLFIFYTFAIIFTYPVYKEMKAQLMESFGGGVGVGGRTFNRMNDEERGERNTGNNGNAGNNENTGHTYTNTNVNSTGNTSSGRFQAFAGRGTAVGGN